MLLLAMHIMLTHILLQNASTNSIIVSNLTNSSPYNFTNPVVGNFTGNFTPLANLNFSTPQQASLNSIPAILSVVLSSPAVLLDTLVRYGYTALFVLMMLDAASLPPPSELVLPPAGFLARQGYFNFGFIFLMLMLASIVGFTMAYAVGYFLGEDFIRRHVKFLHIDTKTLDSFQDWFNEKGALAVFIGRLLPVVRILISFPAGVAKMPYKRYLLFSLAGSAIYNYLLMLFGYLLVSESTGTLLMAALGAVAVVFYVVHRLVVRRILHEDKT